MVIQVGAVYIDSYIKSNSYKGVDLARIKAIKGDSIAKDPNEK